MNKFKVGTKVKVKIGSLIKHILLRSSFESFKINKEDARFLLALLHSYLFKKDLKGVIKNYGARIDNNTSYVGVCFNNEFLSKKSVYFFTEKELTKLMR